MKVQVTATKLNIRKKPFDGEIIGQLSKGDSVFVAENYNGWYRISTGWISGKFAEPIAVELPLSLRALEIAKSQMGLGEIPKGSNWGLHVQKYLNSVSISVPSAWCMAFVYWCVNEASNGANPLFKTGHVLTQLNKSAKLVVKGTPERGDIFIMDFGGGKGHTGFVSEVKGDRIMTIEGNSNSTGSREGVEVCAKPNGRPIRTIKAFLRIS